MEYEHLEWTVLQNSTHHVNRFSVDSAPYAIANRMKGIQKSPTTNAQLHYFSFWFQEMRPFGNWNSLHCVSTIWVHTVTCERRFFMHAYFSNDTVFPDNCDDWTNENVSFGSRNYETNIHSSVH